MIWKNAKLLFITTATAVVATQMVKKIYRYISASMNNPPADAHFKDAREDLKNREINDVILFSNEIIRHTLKTPLSKEISLRESREMNCFKLIRYLKSARETLDVCMYLITSNEITEQIIRLGQKHILVRIIADSEMSTTPQSQISKLKEYSFIQVQTNKKSILMHHKFCIIDGPKAVKRKSILKSYAEKLNIHAQLLISSDKLHTKNKSVKPFVMSGSLNWSTQAMVSNHESVIVTSNANIVNKFEKEFESLWVESDPVLVPSL